jgi:putative IMPACT (imprinted ancient) family translation regulator
VSVPLSTLAAPARLAQEVRKSKFVANAANAPSPQAALAFIETVADRSATHNCWAYRISSAYRFSDDGEPGGTAGKPILQAIDGQGIDQVVVVVTRWFGGIKLGAGGLMRAYGGCAAECLRGAARRTLIVSSRVEVMLAFPALPLLRSRLAELGAEKIGETFGGDGAIVQLRLPSDRVETLRALLADLTRGRAQLRVLDDS